MSSRRVLVGTVGGAVGVRGWVKIHSDTDPRESVFSYAPWEVLVAGAWVQASVKDWRWQGKALVAKLDLCESREQAQRLSGADIAVYRDQLPAAPEGQVYWADLLGLRVRTREGTELGVVDRLMETGANDVLVVRGERERLIPYLPGDVVLQVHKAEGTIEVDWDVDL